MADVQSIADLRQYLGSIDFRFAEDGLRSQYNECEWYAWRPSALPAIECETNDGGRAQIVVKPNRMTLRDRVLESVAIDLTGEAGGSWWSLQAYRLQPSEVPTQLERVERSLIAAWNALERM